MYHEIIEALQEADKDPNVKIALLTGEGDFYSSGNDLSNFANIPPEGPQKMASDAREVLKFVFTQHFYASIYQFTFEKKIVSRKS